MQDTEIKLSDTVIALLRYAKAADNYFVHETLVKELREALGGLYHPDMKLNDILLVTLNSFLEIQNEPRFEVKQTDMILDLLKAPVKYAELLNHGSFKSLDNWLMSVTEIILCQIVHMLQIMRFSNIGWCREIIFIDKENAKQTST